MMRIVVGVDGSPHSRRALRRALEEAALREGSVDAVFVFSPPHRSWADDLIGLPQSAGAALGVGTVSPDAPAHHPPSREVETMEAAEKHLANLIDDALADVDGPRPRPVAIAADHPAEALIAESRTADLLVIGTRGLGGFVGMLLGSVAHQCIQHSHCPLLILPPESE